MNRLNYKTNLGQFGKNKSAVPNLEQQDKTTTLKEFSMFKETTQMRIIK